MKQEKTFKTSTILLRQIDQQRWTIKGVFFFLARNSPLLLTLPLPLPSPTSTIGNNTPAPAAPAPAPAPQPPSPSTEKAFPREHHSSWPMECAAHPFSLPSTLRHLHSPR
ncbi:hypothetical protein V1478_004886 [Vespula squamosa]|uniref:Uncharacterized protein n=1 Tax=Vespula squamosa TaxID=30214 RepID=A0ABD2BF05_VESSQ